MKLIFFRELLWLFVALTTALLLSFGLRLLLLGSPDSYRQLLDEVGSNEQYLHVVLYLVCFLGIYVSRLAVAAVGLFAESVPTASA
ncbi:hypothetical protein LJY25_02705 [Hymenobacter sp. BT175]|uniref:hypothetical protein n=1 Tax=Hymenobacter translucens TaxID=2886507 RepID=UPI001D0DE3C4|nr:hypothetical protein [Hymenobacter translucens]MCC2545341.1 hypothetical protein [Hymenobacter translucens]